MPFSFHSHSAQFCKHASGGSLADVVDAARQSGYRVFGLSEHMPRYSREWIYPEEADLEMSCDDLVTQFNGYVDEARRLQQEYDACRDRGDCCLELLVGAETEYTSSASVKEILELRNRYKLDYVVGSIHHVRGIPIDFSKSSFEDALVSHWHGNHQALFGEYFDEQLCLIEGVKPEIVGHFDVIRKYCSAVPFGEEVLEKVRRNLHRCVELGLLVEINSSGIAKGCRRPYPQEDVMTIAKDLGVKFTLGDDAHSPGDVALYYSHVRQYLHDFQLDQCVYRLVRSKSGQTHNAGQDMSFHFVSSQLIPSIVNDDFWLNSPTYELAET